MDDREDAMTEPAVRTLEAELVEMSRGLTEPRDRECLRCYLLRMLNEFGCTGTLRWSEHWRDLRAPRARALARRLAGRGGFCDCEVILNVYPQHTEAWQLNSCIGVSRRGSTEPCSLSAP
jgi:hypothetical protein